MRLEATNKNVRGGYISPPPSQVGLMGGQASKGGQGSKGGGGSPPHII